MTVSVGTVYCNFNRSIAINDLIKIKDTTYIILDIIRAIATGTGCYAKCALQDINSFPVSDKYEIDEYAYSFPLPSTTRGYQEPWKVGSILLQQETGVAVKINGIKDFHYELTDLIINYDMEIVPEFNLYELNQILKDHKLQKWKLISNNADPLKEFSPKAPNLKLLPKGK